MTTQDKILFRDARIVTMNDDREVLDGDMLVVDGRIAALDDAIEEPDARVVDLGGKTVIPGLVQTHIHLCQVLMRNCADDMSLMDWLRRRIWPYEAALEPDELAIGARIGLAEAILSGTTALLDFGTVHHTDAIAEAIEAAGIRAVVGKCMMDQGEALPGPLREDPGRSLRDSIELYRRWEGGADGRIHYAFTPRFAVSCSDGLLREVAEAADDLGARMQTHASETTFENEYTRERHGLSNIAYLHDAGLCSERSVFAHGVHVDDHDCELLATSRTAITHCPSANLKLASGIADLVRYDRHGVRLGLGTDGAPCNNHHDAFAEMRLAALLQKPIHGPEAMPAERVLRLATRDGALAMGLADHIGSLEVGKSADLVVLDLDADPGAGPGGDVYSRLVYSARAHNVVDVWASGRQLVDDRRLVGVDIERLMARGREALGAVRARMERYFPEHL